MKNILKFSLLFFVLASNWAHAEDVAPDVLARAATEEVLSIIRGNEEFQVDGSDKILALVEEKIVPKFNLVRMTQLATGKYWRQTSSEQRSSLVNEFSTLLIRTYASSLAFYRDQVIEFEPFKMNPNDTDVTVLSSIRRPGKQAVSVDYSMSKTANGWKVYDVAVGGVSLVITYRGTFANEINRNGVDGLINLLANKNKENQRKMLLKQ